MSDRDGAYLPTAKGRAGRGLRRIRENHACQPHPSGRDTTTGLALLERRTVHTHDINAMPGYRPDIVAGGFYRTNLAFRCCATAMLSV